MGTKLMNRSAAGLTPTSGGAAIVKGLTELVAGLSELRQRCHDATTPNRLRVGVGAALAANWLVKRLPHFAHVHPEITIELAIVENEQPESLADLDLRILWVPSDELRATSTQTPLFQECVFPVCRPNLLPADHKPGDVLALTRLPLIHKGVPGVGQGKEYSWACWFDRYALGALPPERLRFTALGPAIAAAELGIGVALARSMLVQDALTEGRLVRVLPTHFDMRSYKAHVMRWAAALAGDSRLRAFTRWLNSRTFRKRHRSESGGIGFQTPTTQVVYSSFLLTVSTPLLMSAACSRDCCV
jgi:LysR family glycine cleavage system transcriptional activator